MIDDNVLTKLNDKQREAVFETEGYVRVIAGAGSGKTKLLVSRYAYLVQEYGIDSANILCVTFTNKAAGEMKKRIRALIGDGYDTNLICTYHGFCNRLLRDNPEKLFLNKQFQIIDSYQQKTILSEIYQKYELKLDYASFESILHKLGQFKSNSDYVPRICNPEPCQIMDQIVEQEDQIMEDFLQRQKATYSLDFNDLIAFAIYVLERDADVREKWQEKLNYIMVDEFQDSSSREMTLINILSRKYQNLMIVGDPDQNIYEWRGSDVKLLVDFDKTHEPTNTIFLNQNYRSTPQILKCANTLIEKNVLRLKKDLFTDNPFGDKVIHYHSRNDFEEMDQIVSNIKRLMKSEGCNYSDFAILYRSGFLSRIAEKKLVEANIPYEIYGGVKFYQRMEILDILAYLKLIAFDDDASFKRIINTPRRKFGRAKLTRLENIKEGLEEMPVSVDGQVSLDDYMDPEYDLARNGRINSLYETLKEGISAKDKDFYSNYILSFVALVDRIRQLKNKMRISEIVNEVTSASGYEQYIRELGDEERLDNLAEFKRIANEFEREFGENLTLEEFLQQIALQSGEGSDADQDAVKLMTIHAAKGLEFPTVFILGFTEGIFPSSKTIEERKELGLEEERRLCYVAITRAEKHLFLMDSEGVSPKGIKKLCSRFLDEIGTDNYTTIGKISEELKDESRKYINKLNSELTVNNSESPGKGIGESVEHHIFGHGVIEASDDKRNSYIVKFDSLSQPRSISKSYFETDHRDARQIFVEEKFQIENKQDIKGDVCALEPTSSVVNSAGDDIYDLDEPEDDEIQDDYDFEEKDDELETDVEEDYNPKEKEMEETVFLSQESSEELTKITSETRLAMLKAQERAKNSPNLWNRDDVPHKGWTCSGVEDLGAPVGICEMCGYQIIRYAHYMVHPNYHSLVCGCVCAGKMEGDLAVAKEREAELRKKTSRRINFFKRKWKKSYAGNDYLKISGHVVVIYNIKNGNKWNYSIDGQFSPKTYPTRENALSAAFEALEDLRKQ